MGSTISTTARTAARSAARDTQRKARPPAEKTIDAKSASEPKNDPHITARLRDDQPPQYQRKTTAQWSDALKKISGSISSSAWEGEVKAHMQNEMQKERHSAQRSDGANERLPGRQRRSDDSLQYDESGRLTKPTGRVTQIEVLQMFNLRRQDPEKWDVGTIAAKYGLNEVDVDNLLSFSRTYTARIDSDGRVRGYYNDDPKNTISRFEKD